MPSLNSAPENAFQDRPWVREEWRWSALSVRREDDIAKFGLSSQSYVSYDVKET